MKKHRLIIILLSMILAGSLFSQYTFDDCQYAKYIDITDGYCSEPGEFSNVGATPDPVFPNNCSSVYFQNGVWFSFTPTKTAVSIRVSGQGKGGTMSEPKIVIFEDCNTYLQCSPGSSSSFDEMVISQLIIGKTYLIMIESEIGGEGSFELCIDDFTPVPTPESDCKDGVVLCDKSSFFVESLVGIGNDKNEIEPNICIREERASSWYKWTCDQSGTLTFTITPNNFKNINIKSTDIDFAVYELPNGIDDCSGKSIQRCMASGEQGNLTFDQWKQCSGPTGLSTTETDISEDPGCMDNSNNFVAPLNMVSGRSYALIINNYELDGEGFSIDFGGTGTFLGPKADFTIDALQEFECDKTIRFTNESESMADSIVSYSWSFGNGAAPITSKTEGPHDVIYDSFGDKIVALTVESKRGCLVTKLLPIYVEPCCADFTLNVEAEATDPICAEDANGTILGNGSEGNPPYKFSIDGTNFQTVPIFYDIKAGTYNLYIQDKKGCIDTTIVDVIDPPKLIVDAGADKTIELGDKTVINGSYLPPEFDITHVWTPSYNLMDSSDFVTDAWPYKTTSYTLTVVQDETGCTATDQMTVYVNANRKVRIPNIFTPNDDGYNDYLTAYNIKAAIGIEKLRIYDRWGELIFQKDNIPMGDELEGWDGTFKGEKVNSGVYVYLFDIKFLDGVVLPFSGDITVLR